MKIIKTQQVRVLGIVAILLLSGNFVQAQPIEQQVPPPIPNTKHINKIVADLSEYLSLSNKQETQIFNLYITHFEEIKVKLKSGIPSPKEMDALETKFEKEVNSRLSSKQQALFMAHQKKTKQQAIVQHSENQWTKVY